MLYCSRLSTKPFPPYTSKFKARLSACMCVRVNFYYPSALFYCAEPSSVSDWDVQQMPLVVPGERQSKFYDAANWTQLLRASEKLHDYTKMHTRAQAENTYKTPYRVKKNTAFFGAVHAPDALAALKLSSSETDESNAFPLRGKYSIYPQS